MSDTDRSAKAENHAEARRWLAIVEEDIDVAEAAARLPLPRYGASAYHLQQAAERLAKTLMVLTGSRSGGRMISTIWRASLSQSIRNSLRP